VTVNGNPQAKGYVPKENFTAARIPAHERKLVAPNGTRQLLLSLGAKKFAEWTLKQKPLLVTDTTFRDAHQSLFATRLRGYDMLAVAEAVAQRTPNLFSMEMWGGATFDTSMRFLHEDPWQRLRDLRARIPNICFQMLFRGSNAVGYSNYPDNAVAGFVKHAAASGMDIFRIFDSLNYLPNLTVAMDAVQETHAICEAAICYTGNILDPARDKYSLKYYVKLAKELEKMGAHFLAIKDMAGLCKPAAASVLVKALKEEIGIPIHFHTHDTSGIAAASVLSAAEAGVDIADLAIASMSGSTSQPNLNSIGGRVAIHQARHRPRPRGAQRICGLLGTRARLLRAVRYRPEIRQRGGLSARDARRTIHQSQGTGRFDGFGASLAGNRANLRGGEPVVRRHCEGHAEQQGRRRHDDVPHHPRHQAGRRPESGTRRHAVSGVGHRHALAAVWGNRSAAGPKRLVARRPRRPQTLKGRPGANLEARST
jgi:hypothetical protein